jgi:hypothetical protein
MDIKETLAAVIGGAVGAALSFWFACWLRNSDKWKLFQEEVGLIRARFLEIEKASGINGVSKTHRESMDDLTSAVCRIRPYVWNCTRSKLLRLLDDYRSADQRKGTGFWPTNLAANYNGMAVDCFSDPQTAANYLIGVLDDMYNL